MRYNKKCCLYISSSKKIDFRKCRIILLLMSNRFKSGDCYIAKLPNGESPVRLVEKTELGYWKTRSLKHGRVVIVKNESLFLRPCTENDLISCAVTVRPNRRSKKERIFAPLPTKSSRDAACRKPKPKPTKMPPYSMTALDAA